MVIFLTVFAAYILIGLGVFFYFYFKGWPDSCQAMPKTACVCTLFFFPSYVIFTLFCGLWNRIK